MTRWFVRLLLLLLLGLPLACVALLWLAVDNTPLVAERINLMPNDIERAKQVLRRNDPRRMRQGILRTISLPQEDVSLAAGYLASRFARGSSRVLLLQGSSSVRATFELPANPLGRYLNIDAVLSETGRLPRFEQLRVGRVVVPSFLCNWVLESGITRLQGDANYAAAADVVKRVQMRDGMLTVQFEWSDAAAAQIKAVLVPPEDQERWRAYQAVLVTLTAGAPRGSPLTFDRLLVPLLQLAQNRAASGDLAAEHRAAIIVLTFYVNGKGLAALVPAAAAWPAPERKVVTLAGRTDYPQHFTISAALTVTVGSPLSDAVGLYKEVDDSRGGSGFSFNDIAADRAGTRFGEIAVGGVPATAKLHQLLARGLRESDLLPELTDLPEFMTEVEFKRRFGGVGQPAYVRMLADIEQHIAALPLYRR